MPFPWALAFKVIPWTEVIAAAPGVARSAQRLWRQVGNRGELAESELALSDQPYDDRLAFAEEELIRLDEQVRQQAELVSELAEQNAKLVQAVEVLRQRSRVQGVVSALLAAGLLTAFLTLA